MSIRVINSSSSNSNSNNGGGNQSGVSSIPAKSREAVQRLKEVVDCPEHEIYAMLKECNMDLSDTVHRLLSQDTFHEVKSKKDKKKETKDTLDFRPRASSTTSRGGRGAADRNFGRGRPVKFSSTESALHGKPPYKKENGFNAYPGSSTSSSNIPENNINRRPAYLSESLAVDNKPHPLSSDNAIPSQQPSPGFQPAWSGLPGKVSMADIVKMGRPQAKPSRTPTVSAETSYSKHNAFEPTNPYHIVKEPLVPAPPQSGPNHDSRSLHDPSFKVSDAIYEGNNSSSKQASHDEWPMVEQSPRSSVSVLEPSSGEENNDMDDRHLNSHSDEIRVMQGDATVENFNTDSAGSASESKRHIPDDGHGGSSHLDNDSFNNMDSYQRRTFDHQEGNDSRPQLSMPNYSVSSADDVKTAVSSAVESLQQLSFTDDVVGSSPEDNPSVKIPHHLQVPSSDCLHLSFGSFGSFASKPPTSTLEEVSAAADVSLVSHPETRSPEYYSDEQFRSMSDGNVDPRAGAGSFETSSSQPEVMKQDNAETTLHNQYNFPTSMPGYSFENGAQPNTAFSYAHADPQMQNLTAFSNVMQAYANPISSNLLASTVLPSRESDVPYSPFQATQSMPTKFTTSGSSISGPTISTPETLKPGAFSTPHPSQQTLPGASIATGGPSLPQHVTLHSYSQPTLPLGHFAANMIGYPFLPQSYAYLPSAFQQAYAGNSTYHQSPAAVHGAALKYSLPQYKSNVPVSNMPQSAAIPTGYGGFGGSTGIPGSFPLNPSSNPSSSTMGYDDVINSQYKDNSHFLPIQQNESSAVWVHGPGSRTVSAVPASTYYGFQGQNQQHSAFRQGQQASQQYGALGYPNYYQSQAGVSQEHQQQTSNDGNLGGSQGPSSKQSHQLWQHSY